MSTFLHSLGLRCARHARLVLAVWLCLLVAGGAAVAAVGNRLGNDFVIPGTEAQQGLDQLRERFPEFAGVSGQLLVRAADGSPVEEHREAIGELKDRVSTRVSHIAAITDPWSPFLRAPAISEDGRSALINIQFDFRVDAIDAHAVSALEEVAAGAGDLGLAASTGGQIYQMTSVPMSATELIGVGVALLVLAATFGALLPAMLPIVSALLGVGIGMEAVLLAAAEVDISTTTPTLAVMIALAVGIDYCLFIVSRHRAQLAHGWPVEESIAMATATSGGAVVFAATTVIIALAGLLVSGIPFLAVMGLCAAFSVGISGIVAVTAIPALLGLAGGRLTPRAPRRPRATGSLGLRWVRAVTRHPALTLAPVLALLVLATLPAATLRLSLPDNGVEPVGTPARDTFDAVADSFGPGANAPLLVIGDVITSTDPVGLVADLADRAAEVPGVASIQVATPNRSADLGIVVVVPEGAGDSAETEATVRALREAAPRWEEELGIENIRVTGLTAAKIDVTDRLTGALAPFALVVVGLALVILTVVFRSVWVPLTATIGYLLSVGAAFGVTALVFGWEPLNSALGIGQTGPVICFMPIMVLGVLFGLAMDYEVFLVTRMREEWSRGTPAVEAVRAGFVSSSRVVTAAALIMVAVFVGFIPHGSFYVQPIALGLAVGVAADAFLVRMTLIPAVMTLLGEAAWWCPRPLARLLPHVDIEGGAMDHLEEHLAWSAEHGPTLVRVEGLELQRGGRTLVHLPHFVARQGEYVRIHGEAVAVRLLFHLLSGRGRPDAGLAVVAGMDTRDRGAEVRARVALLGRSHYVEAALRDLEARQVPAIVLLDCPLSAQQVDRLLRVSARHGGLLLVGPGAPASLPEPDRHLHLPHPDALLPRPVDATREEVDHATPADA